MPLEIRRCDIASVPADAVVNAANAYLMMGSGVCGSIFRGAGAEKMQAACDAIGGCKVGHAVVTPGFDLPAKYVFHAVGPVWRGGDSSEEEFLRSCYRSCLSLAKQYELESIAFPLISAGSFGYPREAALDIALSEFRRFLETEELHIILVLFDSGVMRIGKKLALSIQSYIDDHYVEEHYDRRRQDPGRQATLAAMPKCAPCAAQKCAAAPLLDPEESNLSEILSKKQETFSGFLFRLIDEEGLSGVQLYKRANMDRKLVSKIRSIPGYTPAKKTVLALCVALSLPMGEARELLRRAGYAFSPCSKTDLIVSYFLEAGHADIFTVNEALFSFGEDTL